MDTTLLVLMLLASIASYIIVGVRLMRLCDASGVSNGWFSFIPLLAETRMARLTGANPWLVAIVVIPVVGWIVLVVLDLIWLFRIAAHSGATMWWWVSLLGPVAFGIVSGAFGDSTALGLIVSIVGIAVMTYARMMIFDPAKPMTVAGSTSASA